MTRRTVFLVLLFYLLAGCSANNRIRISEQNGLKAMRLVQSPHARMTKGKDGLTGHSGPMVKFNYLYEQKDKGRPVVTLRLPKDKPPSALQDSMLIISLGGENISLISAHGLFIIPENLWVPIVHSSNIHYKLKRGDEEIVIKLKAREKDKLIEFFIRAIKHRDAIFPAIPEGQKKW